ncbi:MAG: 4-alpha-glucanotransferase [Acidobacteriales bacterium]|nr:4-alpha-glucanotransferase [Terriglobales bacterium]
MSFERASGILLHPTSFPSRGGVGDFGPEAYKFLEWMTAAKQGLWQVLPLNPTGLGNSPYSATSAFAGNPLLISLDRLAEQGWISEAKISKLPITKSRADFGCAYKVKLPLLREAAKNFLVSVDSKDEFYQFCRENRWWLEDFVMFDLMRRRNNGKSWTEWEDDIKRRKPEALRKLSEDNREELDVDRVLQFAFWTQWRALREECRERGIKIIGDVAIFVNFDSADVWSHPELFQLDANLMPTVVSGVPPDFFSKTGQRWGNPLYRWDVLKKRGYDWWIQRMKWATQACDYIRLDHFRGFEAYWEIPAAEKTAVNGRWVDGPKGGLFDALGKALGKLPFIAEDLGTITEGVTALRDHYDMPGMRILQFGWSDKGAHMYLPHRFEKNTVVYTGTHDNDTTLGWWKGVATEKEKRAVLCYLRPSDDGLVWAFIRAAFASVADLAIVPLQDVLELDTEARMNTPSCPEGNWGWRYGETQLRVELADKLAQLTEVTDRVPSAMSQESERNGPEEVPAD